MAATRWERERSAWLMERSRPGTMRRRRAEMLGLQARKATRGSAGIDQMSMREDITPPLWRRLLVTEDGVGERLTRLIGVPVLYGTVGLVVGPAMLVAAGIYKVLWSHAPKIGRLWAWPWLVAGVLLWVIQGLSFSFWGPMAMVTVVPWPLGLDMNVAEVFASWLLWQTSLGLVFTGAHILRSGWMAVKPGAVPKPDKDKNGQFRVTPDYEKVKLDPYGEHEAERAQDNSPAKISLSADIPDNEV